MKILTWNINGLRSMKKSIENILINFDADIVCFQETKVSRNLLQEDVAIIEGYNAYFSFPKKQSGYSGVATYCRNNCTPKRAEDSLIGKEMKVNEHIQRFDLQSLDNEGRVMITYHDIKQDSSVHTVAIINVYCPRVDPEKPERHIYKMEFLALLEAKAKALLDEGCSVIILGDLNISHRIIDHCDPGDEKEFNISDGRKWLTSFLSASDNTCEVFLDTFRYLFPDRKEAYTCWNTLTGARQTNYGTRIDYILISHSLLPLLSSCDILADVHGSDHCPVAASLSCTPMASKQLPPLCTRLWPEFSGKQQKLSNFVQKSVTDHSVCLPLKRKSPVKEMSSKKCKGLPKAGIQKSITNFFGANSNQSRVKKIEDVQVTDHVIMEDFNCGADSGIGSSESEHSSQGDDKTKQKDLWKSVLKGPPKAPLCKGHNKPCVLRTVKKDGANFGRQFFACALPNGSANNPDARCDFFQWATGAKRNVLKA